MLRVLLAEDSGFAALGIEGGLRRAGVVRAKVFPSDLHHAVISVLLAVHRRLAGLDIESRRLSAGVL